MELRNLGYRTDAIFHRYDGRITDRGDYLVIETPSNPGFFWGNLLIFNRAPSISDFPRWNDTFRAEFHASPEVRHVTLAWDTNDPASEAAKKFTDNGFDLEVSSVLVGSAATLRLPPKLNSEVRIRLIQNDSEWQAVIDNQVECRESIYEEVPYRVFKTRQVDRYRKMSEAGLGHWFGAYLEDRLVADLGLYRDGSLGRFQQVATHPDFRRRGICGTLVHHVTRHGYEEMGLKQIVMAAIPTEHAIQIYRSVGYMDREMQYGFCRRPVAR